MITLHLSDDQPASASIRPPTMVKGSWKRKLAAKKQAVRRIAKEQVILPSPPMDISKAPIQDQTKSVSAPPTHRPKEHYISSLFSASDPFLAPQEKSKSDQKKESSDPYSSKASAFSELGLNDRIVQHLSAKLGLTRPTPIQSLGIPAFLNSDQQQGIILQAQTGSGKSLAFLLPILHLLLSQPASSMSRSVGTLGLILVPTRELAQQLYAVLQSLLSLVAPGQHWIVPGLLIGGEKKKSEKARLRKGVSLLVCTPGRLLDHLKTTTAFDVSGLKWMVLDEADHLLQLGFEESLTEILKILKEKRGQGNRPPRTILCSATIHKSVSRLAELAMEGEPLFIQASSEDAPETLKKKKSEEETQIVAVPSHLEQLYLIVPAKLRLVTLLGGLRHIITESLTPSQIIVFLSCCDSVDFHYDVLAHSSAIPSEQVLAEQAQDNARQHVHAERARFHNPYQTSLESPLTHRTGDPKSRSSKLACPGGTNTHLSATRLFKLHGNMTQGERVASYNAFMSAPHSSVLFCTDVAARGLDLPNITHILQVDPPADIKDYIHRVGRSGRMGKAGQTFLFLLPSERDYVQILESHELSLKEHKLLPFLSTFVPKEGVQPDGKKKDFEIAATQVHMNFEQYLLENSEVCLLKTI